MTRHTTKEILATFAKGAEHDHEAAAQATYNLGFAAGEESIKEKILASDDDLHREIDERHERARDAARAKAEAEAPPAGEEDEEKDAKAGKGKKAAHTQAAAGAASGT